MLSRSPEEIPMPEPERIDRRRAALIAYDVCRRALAPADPARRAAMRPVLEAWTKLIGLARTVGVPVIGSKIAVPVLAKRWRYR